MAKILVTGSEGLIGKELVKKLLARRHVIQKFDLRNGQDILDLATIKNSVKQVEGVIHLAATSRVVSAYQDPYLAVTTNIVGTTNILESIREINPKCWMIYASSREVYGEAGVKVDESEPLNSINVYGASKIGAEFITLNYGSNYNLKTFVVRFSNIYGGENDYEDRVIPRFIKQALSNSDFTINRRQQKLDFVHLEDATDALIALMDKILANKKLPYRVFQFVTGKGITLLELAQILTKITKSRSKIKYFPERSYDINSFVGDPQRSKNILGWEAKIFLEEGLSMYIDLLRSKS